MPNGHFSSLLIIVFLAFIVPVILSRFKRLRLPIVVGEILAGVIIGRSGFQLIPSDEPILVFLADLGFVFLMFLSGMEIDFSSFSLSSRSNNNGPQSSRFGPASLAAISFALTLVCSFAISFGLVHFGLAQNVWMMALILSTTSLGVVVPVLKEKRLIGGKFGQTLLFSALIADFVTMILITIMIAALSQGLTFNVLLIGLLFVVFFIIFRFGNFLNKLPGVRGMFQELSHATAQIKVRGAFTIMMAFIVLSQALGTEIILGAFLAGACLALLKTPEDYQITNQLESIGYGFLIPIFFIKVGIDINLGVILSSPKALLLVPLLVVAAFAVKFVPAMIFRFNYNWKETIAAGALLSARLSLIIAAASISLTLGIISETMNAAILLVAILTVTLAPLLFSAIHSPDETQQQIPIVVVGADELGLQVASQLSSHKEQVVTIDQDEHLATRAERRGFNIIAVDFDCLDGQAENYFKQAQTLICTYADTELNFHVCQIARTNYGIPNVIAWVTRPSDAFRFEQLGVNTINAALDLSSLLVMMARNPTTYALLTRSNDNKEVYEVVVENEVYAGKSLRQLNLPGDILVLALRRNGELLVPHGNTRIELGDHLTLVSSNEWIAIGQALFI